jgi:hypothetical protein
VIRIRLAAVAALLACSGGSGDDAPRAGDLLGRSDGPGRLEGRVTIGPLCPVEQVPPDPSCAPGPETFAAVEILIFDPAGAVVRRVALDDEGRYAVELDAGVYLVDTTWRGLGEGGGDPTPGDSGSAGDGSGIADPGDDGAAGGTPGEPPSVVDSTGTGTSPPGAGGTDPGVPDSVLPSPVDPAPVPPAPGDPGRPPDDPPAPCDPIWPPDAGGPGGVVPGDAPSVADSTGCSAPGSPGDPGAPVPPDSAFPEPPVPGDTAAPPPITLPFPGDSLAERPDDGAAVPEHLLPVEVQLGAGETKRLDIDIDTGIR